MVGWSSCGEWLLLCLDRVRLSVWPPPWAVQLLKNFTCSPHEKLSRLHAWFSHRLIALTSIGAAAVALIGHQAFLSWHRDSGEERRLLDPRPARWVRRWFGGKRWSSMQMLSERPSHTALIDHLQRIDVLRSPRVRDAMLAIDRATFVDPDRAVGWEPESYVVQPYPAVAQPAWLLDLHRPL